MSVLDDFFQMKPTRCTLLLSFIIIIIIIIILFIFLFFLFHLSTCMGGCLVCRPASHPHRTKNTNVA